MSDLRPPVDPMNDLSWARIERGLWSRLDGITPSEPLRARKRWLWIAVPSVAVAGAIAAVFALVIDTPALPSVGREDAVPTRVVSGASPSTLSLGDAHIALDAQTALVMQSQVASTTAVLERGAAKFSIAHREGKQFVVVAGDTTVRVVGTIFRVSRSDERAVVAVERGLVDVTFHGTTMKVAAGQTWTSDAPASVTPIAASPATASPATSPVASPAADLPAADLPAASPAADVAVVDAPVTADAVRGDDTLRAAPKHIIDASKHVDTSKRIDTPNRDGAQPANTDDERAKYERARAIEAKDAPSAMALYLDVAKGNSAWAAMSLYAAGRLADDRGEARAKILLNAYLRRFPRGANANDARKLIDRGAPE